MKKSTSKQDQTYRLLIYYDLKKKMFETHRHCAERNNYTVQVSVTKRRFEHGSALYSFRTVYAWLGFIWCSGQNTELFTSTPRHVCLALTTILNGFINRTHKKLYWTPITCLKNGEFMSFKASERQSSHEAQGLSETMCSFGINARLIIVEVKLS